MFLYINNIDYSDVEKLNLLLNTAIWSQFYSCLIKKTKNTPNLFTNTMPGAENTTKASLSAHKSLK